MYYNRDLSWLEFNYRVLREAKCEHAPLYERIKFLSIFSSNFDEFFSIRYPVILAISNLKTKTRKKIDDQLPNNFLDNIKTEIERQYREFDDILTTSIIPELEANNIILYYNQEIRKEHADEVSEIFLSKVLSFLRPIFLSKDIAQRFIPEANKIYMIISVKKKHEDLLQHAILQIPSDSLKRFYKLSPINNKRYLIFIDDIIKENVKYLFPGFEIEGTYTIKFNRNQDIDYRDDYYGDILKIIKKRLAKRARGYTSRFVYDRSMPRNVQLYIALLFDADNQETFAGGHYHNLSDLAKLPIYDKALTYSEWKPLPVINLSKGADIFNKIEEKDILLHFPYHSYNTILFYFNQAAIDPDVSEIYVTLYRLASGSLIANALISAAKNGKKVTVFIELKARFDEENNITWSEKMKNAGVRIIYSIPGIKVHTKIALVVRNSGKGRKCYALISTGNFNELTARYYSDHTLLTTDQKITSDLLTLFQFLENREKPTENSDLPFNKLIVSQFNMLKEMEKLILNEIKKAKKTGNGFIRIKLNNLEEPGMIDLLYSAARAGVEIQLIVRSICCLIPGIRGLSENIKVKRLVDRYLEHTRILIFGNNADAKIIIGSSDWMTRNLYHRIELCTPIEDPACRQELLDFFDLQWQDKNETLQPDAQQETNKTTDLRNTQQYIYNYLRART